MKNKKKPTLVNYIILSRVTVQTSLHLEKKKKITLMFNY